MRSHTIDEANFCPARLPVDEPYYGLNLMNDNLEMQHDHFLMDAHPHHHHR
jgi:hypothetical protein